MTRARSYPRIAPVLAFLALPGLAEAQPTRLSVEDWRADLAALVEHVEPTHPAPFRHASEDRFRDAVAALDADIPTLSDTEVTARLMQLAALLEDGHTMLLPAGDPGFDTWYPVRFYRFSDGLYVTAIDPAHADVAGTRVLRIGDLAAEEAHARAASLVGADNAFGRMEAVHYLSSAPALHALGVTPMPDVLTLVVEWDGGATRTVTLAPFERDFGFNWRFWGEVFGPVTHEDNRERLVTAHGLRPMQYRDRLPDVPLHLRNRIPWWVEPLPEADAVYLQMNFVERGWAGESFEDFTRRAFALVDSVGADVLILDLRYNSGGDGSILIPFVHEIIRRPRIHRPGHLFTLVGRKTFSAGVMLIDLLLDHTPTLLVGEPPGAALNHAGDAASFTLPHSGHQLFVSTLYHQLSRSDDTARVIPVQIPVAFDGPTFFTSGDPALDTVLGALPYRSLAQVLVEDGAEAVRTRFDAEREAWDDVDWWRPFHEHDMNDLGYDLLGDDRVEDAVAAFEMNAAVFPDSWNVWDSLAEAYLARGDQDLAVETYRRSLALNPANDNARRMIEQIERGDH